MRILFSPPLPEPILKLFSSRLPSDCALTVARQGTPAFATALPEAEAYVGIPHLPLDEAFFRQAARLQLVQLITAGYENVDLAAASGRGASVCNNGGANSHAVAEHTLTLILAALKNLAVQHRNVAAGRWRVGGIADQRNSLAKGRTLGLLGFGEIARKVAAMAAAFGMEVIYHRRKGADAEGETNGPRPVALDELLRASDVLSLHAPLTEATRNLIDRERLALMKPGAVLINTSRGALVDESALVEALRSGRLGFAALDVMGSEPPPPDHPLLGLDNVIITPHIAAVSMDCWPDIFDVVVENLRRTIAGESPRFRVR